MLGGRCQRSRLISAITWSFLHVESHGECVAKDVNYAKACAAFDETPCREQSLVCDWKLPSFDDALSEEEKSGQIVKAVADSKSRCLAEYNERHIQFLQTSGAWLHVRKKEHSPTSHWEDYVAKLDHFSAVSDQMGQWENRWMEFLYTAATEQILVCWSFGGIYWDAVLERPPGHNDVGKWKSQQLRSSVCAPDSCSQQELEGELLPQFFAQKLLASGNEVRSEHLGRARADQVSHWADLTLDFAILGVDGCGTTSLHQNLAKHPSLAFTNFSVHSVDEDWFMNELGTRTLPLQSHRELLEAARADKPSRFLGTYNPLLWSEMTSFFMIALQGIRLVLTVCDPVDRLEKRVFSSMQADGLDFEEALRRELQDERLLLGDRLRAWQGLGDRLLVVHIGALRSKPAETYRRITDFLGVVPFSKKMRFRRYNSARGNRSGLCNHPDRIHQLQDLFQDDYVALEEVLAAQSPGEELPRELRLRQTRCERPNELKDLPCSGFKGPCQD